MYKKIIFFIISTLTILSFPKVQAKDTISAWIITDIHYLSPSLHDQTGAAIQHIRNTGAGKDFDYGAQRMEALIHAIQSNRPDLLIISGDLTLNGEYQSMEDLAEYFQRIEALGTAVYVIPGNHDISSGWARAFKEDSFIRTRQVLPKDFINLFENYGYQEAFSKDNHSLSYAIKISNELWLLMIDSNVYSSTEGEGAPPTHGILKNATLTWIESILKEADTNNVRILPVTHHNAITHFKRLEKNYTIDNATDYRELLFHYHVPVNFSGHIHTQHIQTLFHNDQQLTDIVTGAFSSYPSYIGKLTIDKEHLVYQAEPLDVSAWTNQINIVDQNLRNFDHYMSEIFLKSSRQMAFREMIEGGWYQKNNPLHEELADYVGIVNLAFFAGKPLDHFDLSQFSNLDQIRHLINTKSSTFFKEYIQAIEANNMDYTTFEYLW